MNKKIKMILLAFTLILITCLLLVILRELSIRLSRFADTLSPSASATPCPVTTCTPNLNDRRIAFSSNRFHSANEIYVMNADGTCVTQLTDFDRHNANSPRWSPDGSQILFELRFNRVFGPGRDTDLYVIAADGSRVTRLTKRGKNVHGHWSPDGSKIAFLSDRDEYDALYMMQADGSHETRLADIEIYTMFSANEGDPAWSPDGTQIAFTGLHPEQDQSEVYVINADGSSLTNLTNNSATDELLTWLPGENKILFTSRPTMNSNEILYVMDADGTNVQRIIDLGPHPSVNGWLPTSTLQLILTDGGTEIYILDLACTLEVPSRAGIESLPKECYHQFHEPYHQQFRVYPYWSSGDPQILFHVFRTELQSDIAVTNFDGTGATKLTNCSADNDNPDWSP